MSVTKNEVLSTAELARLDLSEKEVSELEVSMSNIVTMFDDLSKVCTDKVKHLDILPKQKLEKFPEQNPNMNSDMTDYIPSFAVEFDSNTKEFLAPKVIEEE